jgi:5'(3')-deoxyribonucleotidase
MTRFLIDPEFILKMPVIDGSQSAIRELAKYNIRVVSARRPETEKATKQWLNMHFPCLKEYYRASTGAKHNIPSNVLIDDLDLNIIEFVRSDPNRRGVLFWHPWSLNETEIHKYANQVYFCRDWKNVVKAILELDII